MGWPARAAFCFQSQTIRGDTGRGQEQFHNVKLCQSSCKQEPRGPPAGPGGGGSKGDSDSNGQKKEWTASPVSWDIQRAFTCICWLETAVFRQRSLSGGRWSVHKSMWAWYYHRRPPRQPRWAWAERAAVQIRAWEGGGHRPRQRHAGTANWLRRQGQAWGPGAVPSLNGLLAVCEAVWAHVSSGTPTTNDAPCAMGLVLLWGGRHLIFCHVWAGAPRQEIGKAPGLKGMGCCCCVRHAQLHLPTPAPLKRGQPRCHPAMPHFGDV